MEITTLIKKLLLIGVVGFVLIIFLFWWNLYRTKSTNISQVEPFSEIIGKEMVAEQESFIALNYEHFVEENPYILQMHNRFYEDAGASYMLPKGTIFTIEDAKSFYHSVSGSSHSYILGSVYIKELNQIVKFEFQWGSQSITDLSDNSNNYHLYHLAPWQEAPFPFKFYGNGTKTPYVWEALIKDYDFSMIANRFIKRDDFQKNRSFDNFYEKQEDWGPEKPYFGMNNELSHEDISHLKLAEIYPDYEEDSDKYTFHTDYKVHLSNNFLSLIITVFKGEHEMESQLVNYDLNGGIAGHLKISYDEISEGITKKVFAFKGSTITVTEHISETSTSTTFSIQEDGIIAILNQ